MIGIDEVGRGPIAGPVAVCALLWKDREFDPPHDIKDSKQLSAQKREAWFEQIETWRKQDKLAYEVSYVDAKTIDLVGISHAIKLALLESLSRLEVDPEQVHILLDGSLYAPEEYRHQETIVRGDEQEPLIALASIAAKVSRDRMMEDLAETFPAYGFENHKGYGTDEHYRAIRKHGITKYHRKSFLQKVL